MTSGAVSEAPAIVGAGLSGLLAAHAWPRASIFEASPAPSPGHRALLRFRGREVASLVGIDFREVTVRKGIWFEGAFVPPSIGVANAYAMKVLGRLSAERSIWNIDPTTRYVAPESLYEQLIEAVGSRIRWREPFDFSLGRGRPARPVVSTAPLPLVLSALDMEPSAADAEFHRAPIHVTRLRIPHADVFQTVYFPADDTSVYRASITGSLLIVESTEPLSLNDVFQVVVAMHLPPQVDQLDETVQQFGKIAPLANDAMRRRLLFDLSQRHNIYSLGRFATWRNVLLDDVVHDIAVIKRLIAGDAYAARAAAN